MNPDLSSSTSPSNEAEQSSTATEELTAGDDATSSPKVSNKNDIKIEVHLRAVGDAPIMKKRRWMVERARTVGWVTAFIRKYLNMDNEQSQTLFIYVNQCFAPSADQTLDNLFNCFAAENSLVLHYSLVQAWG